MLCYKVVAIGKKGILTSWLQNILPEEFLVQYKEGETVFPKLDGSYLFVFTDKLSALGFSYGNDEQVWTCEADVVDLPVVSCRGREFSEFWEVYSSPHTQTCEEMDTIILTPIGGGPSVQGYDKICTHGAFAKSVKLLERIK